MAKRIDRWLSAAPLVAGPIAVAVLFPATAPRWAFMWTLSFVLYGGCKWLTWREAGVARQDCGKPIPIWRQIGYLAAWPGLDARSFLAEFWPSPPLPREWLFAFFKLLLGAVIFLGASHLTQDVEELVVGWAGMIGVAFLLHFGSFHLLSCFWRAQRVTARPLMNWPIASRSVSEFWGKRWNIAFRDLTHRFLFRPLAVRFGPVWAVLIGFAFSGLIHDLAISLPARGGYGLPTCYFLIQAVGMLVERSRPGRRIGLGRGWPGWLFAAAVVAAPAPLLFHRPFVTQVAAPFLEACRVIP